MENTGVKALPGIFAELKGKYDADRLADAVRLIIKLFENIAAHPVDVKYRSVKKTNATLMSKVFCFSGIERVFRELGFVEDGEFFRFNLQDILPINQGLILLRAQEVSMHSGGADNEATRKRLAEVDSEIRKKEEEKRKLIEQMKNDRADKKQYLKDHPAQDSKGNKLNFGSKLITQGELNPNMNQKGG